jgi:transcription initiation factor TFIID subunit TAF12
MEQEQELLEIFRRMNRDAREQYLSHGRFALVAIAAARARNDQLETMSRQEPQTGKTA